MPMRIHTSSLAFASLLALLSACATTYSPPVETLNTVVFKGVISDRMLIPADSGSGASTNMGTYQPGMGGATGGAVAAALVALKASAGRRPAHYIYDVSSQQDPRHTVRAAFVMDIAVGTCVEVLSEASASKAFAYNYGYALIRPAEGC